MPEKLTPREIEVVRLASLGCTGIEIGAVLGITTSTAESYKRTAKQKLGCNRVALLTRLALKHKITSLSDKLTPAEKRKAGWR